MTIDITPEAVEHLAHHCDIGGDALRFAPTLRALSAALTAGKAETAAVIEAAAELASNIAPLLSVPVQQAIRALTPADSKAALAQMLAEARADGMREAAGVVERHAETGRKGIANALDREEASDWGLIVMRCDLIRDTILASIQKGPPHE